MCPQTAWVRWCIAAMVGFLLSVRSNYLREWWHHHTGSIYSMLQGKEYFDLCLGWICKEFVENIFKGLWIHNFAFVLLIALCLFQIELKAYICCHGRKWKLKGCYNLRCAKPLLMASVSLLQHKRSPKMLASSELGLTLIEIFVYIGTLFDH